MFGLVFFLLRTGTKISLIFVPPVIYTMGTPQNKDRMSVRDLSFKTTFEIGKILDVKNAPGSDYRAFAVAVGMERGDINLISEKDRPTEEIFKWWEPHEDATVQKLQKILRDLRNYDSIKILKKDPKVVKAGEDIEDTEDGQGSSTSDRADTADGQASMTSSIEDTVDGQESTSAANDSPSPPVINIIEFKEMKPDRIDWLKAIHIDVLLIACNPYEFRTAYEILSHPQIADSGVDMGNVYFGEIGQNRVALVKSRSGPGGKTGIEAICTEALKILRPNTIICVGVCFGMDKSKHKLADVLVSNRLATYDAVRVNPDGSEVPRGVIHECKARLSNLFSDSVGWEAPCSDNYNPVVHSGLIISGSQLVDNENRKKQLKRTYDESLGGDMEGIGLYNVCENADVPWIVCKAISDWGDGKKDKTWQPYAAAVAASFVKFVLTRNYIPKK